MERASRGFQGPWLRLRCWRSYAGNYTSCSGSHRALAFRFFRLGSCRDRLVRVRSFYAEGANRRLAGGTTLQKPQGVHEAVGAAFFKVRLSASPLRRVGLEGASRGPQRPWPGLRVGGYGGPGEEQLGGALALSWRSSVGVIHPGPHGSRALVQRFLGRRRPSRENMVVEGWEFAGWRDGGFLLVFHSCPFFLSVTERGGGPFWRRGLWEFRVSLWGGIRAVRGGLIALPLPKRARTLDVCPCGTCG